MNERPGLTAAFIGTRWEALEALRAQCEVAHVLCINGSRVHRMSTKVGLPITVVHRGDRDKTMSQLGSLEVELVLSAGLPWVISADILDSMPHIKLNSHPSLLPSFPGKNAIRDALAAGTTKLGVTVHEMIPEVDAGPIVDQESFDASNLELHEVYERIFGEIEPLVVGRAIGRVLNMHRHN